MQILRSSLTAAALLAAFLLHSCGGTDVPEGKAPPGATTTDFEASATQGLAPLSVTFTDLSNGATSWIWDFGDGRVSNLQNPVHEYAAPGTYTVRLTASGPGGPGTMEKSDLIDVAVAIADAGFEEQTAGALPGAPWTPFGAGGSGTGSHLVRSAAQADAGMPSAGLLWLEVSAAGTNDATPPSNPGGVTSLPVGGAGVAQSIRFSSTHPVLQLDALFVNAEGPLSSFRDWMSIDLTGPAPTEGVPSEITHNIYYRDTFSGLLQESTLHTGDATPMEAVTVDLSALFPTADESTPIELSVQVGNDADGSSPSFGYVDNLRLAALSADPLDAEFTVSQALGGIGTFFAFSDMTAGTPKTWIWDFGDGTAAIGQNPVKVFDAEGLFDVTLRTSSPGVGDAETKVNFVEVDNSSCEQAAFTVLSHPSLCAGTNATVTFRNDSTNATSYLWDFGDGQTMMTASSGNVTHEYASPGDYDASLTAFGPCFGPGGVTTSPQVMGIVNAPSGANVNFTITFPSGTAVSCTPPGFSNNAAAFKNENVRFTATNSAPSTAPLTTFSWEVVGSGPFSTASAVTTSFATPGVRTIRLTASNCAGSVQVTKTIKIVQTWTTVYTYVDNCSACHDGSITMNLSTQGTAFSQIRNANMVNSCSGSPAKRVSIACGGTSNSDLSGIVWALSNDVCGNGNMASNCGCLNPVTNATQVNELRDWIDFGSPNN